MSTEWPPKYDRSYIPSSDSRYWNKELETMDPEERERKVILPKLQAQLKYAYENSPFYKKKWDKAGIGPEDIRSLEDFEHIPFVKKDEIRQDQM
jgi:phenylacetate-CoA ligase